MSYPQGYLYQPPGSLALYSCPAYGASALAAPRSEELARSSSGSAFSPYPGSAAFTAQAAATGFGSPLQYSTDPAAGFPSYMVGSQPASLQPGGGGAGLGQPAAPGTPAPHRLPAPRLFPFLPLSSVSLPFPPSVEFLHLPPPDLFFPFALCRYPFRGGKGSLADGKLESEGNSAGERGGGRLLKQGAGVLFRVPPPGQESRGRAAIGTGLFRHLSAPRGKDPPPLLGERGERIRCVSAAQDRSPGSPLPQSLPAERSGFRIIGEALKRSSV